MHFWSFTFYFAIRRVSYASILCVSSRFAWGNILFRIWFMQYAIIWHNSERVWINDVCVCVWASVCVRVKHKIITNGHYVLIRCGLFELIASRYFYTYENLNVKLCCSQAISLSVSAYVDGFLLFKWLTVFSFILDLVIFILTM